MVFARVSRRGWRAVPRSAGPGFDVTCIHFDASDGRGPFPAHRSSSRPTPDVIRSRLFSHRSTPRSSAKAPVSGLRPPPLKVAPEVQNFLHLLVQHRGPRATSAHLPRSCSQHLLQCPRQGIAPAPEGLPQVPAHLTAGAGTGHRRLSGGCPDHTFRRLGFRQSSFRHIARIPRRTAPYARARSPVSWPAIFPTHLSDHGSAIRSKDTSSSPCPLRGRYSSAPRGARRLRACWAVHSPVGCKVTPRMRMRLLACSITART